MNAELSARIERRILSSKSRPPDLSLGKTTFHAAGTLDASKKTTVEFHGNLALEELSRLLKLDSSGLRGDFTLNGSAKLDARNNYAIDGTLRSRGFSLRRGTMQLPNIDVFSPFHADPSLISLDGLKIDALGGRFAAKIIVEDLRRLNVEGNLRNFSLPVLVSALTGKRLDYDGAINGSLTAKGDLKAKGTTGYQAEARLQINPGTQGIPLAGQINGDYTGSTGVIRLRQSYLAMPHTRIDLSGSLTKQIDIQAISHNLDDFLPAANLGAARPARSLPVALEGGTATSRHK